MHPARPEITPGPVNRHSWQAELARGLRDPAELLAALGLTAAECGLGAAAMARDGTAAFPLRVPLGFVDIDVLVETRKAGQGEQVEQALEARGFALRR